MSRSGAERAQFRTPGAGDRRIEVKNSTSYKVRVKPLQSASSDSLAPTYDLTGETYKYDVQCIVCLFFIQVEM